MKYKKAILTTIILILVIQAVAALSLADTKETDFLFYQMKDPLLYSDIAFQINPAVLNRLTSVFLLNAFHFKYDSTFSDYIRLDNTIGEIGGTHTSDTTLMAPRWEAASFFPYIIKKNRGIWGVAGDFYVKNVNYIDTYVNYNSYTEDLNMVQKYLPINAYLGSFYAMRLVGWDLGFSAGYALAYNPKLFTMATDNSIAPSITYITDTIHATDEYLHTVKARIGTVMDISQAAEFKFAAGYEGGFKDNAAEYIAVDTDGDGRNETIMPYGTYVFHTGTGGPVNPATSFDLKDFTLSTVVTLHPTLRLILAKGADLFISGNYSLFDLQTNTYWKRLRTTADVDDDLSQETATYDASFGTFDVLAGTTIEMTKQKTVTKMSIGYSRRAVRFSQDGLNRAGLSLYNRLNVNNYDELILGTDPLNNALIVNNVIPSDTLYQALIGRAGLEWTPVDKTIFFASLSVAGVSSEKYYYAYNLDTRTVWLETATSLSLDWNFDALAGISFPLSKTLQCTIDYRGLSTNGSFNMFSEEAPFDEEFQRISTNGTTDLRTWGGFNFFVGVTFTLLY